MIYYLIFCTLFLFSFNEVFSNRRKKYLAFVFLIMLLFFAGFRDSLGTDYKTYSLIYYGVNNINDYSYLEIGFRALILFSKFISTEPWSMFLLATSITIIFIGSGIKKSSVLPLFSVFLFFSVFFINYTFNGIRQGISMAIFLFSVESITEDKRLIKVLFYTLLASLFHLSGLFILLAYIFAKIPIHKKLYKIFFIILILLFFLSSSISVVADNILPTVLINKLNVFNQNFSESVNIINIAQRVIILLLMILFYDKIFIGKKQNRLFKIYFLGFVLYSMFSFQIVFATRINMFFRILEILIFPLILQRSKDIPTKLFFFIIFSIWAFLLLSSDISNPYNAPYQSLLF